MASPEYSEQQFMNDIQSDVEFSTALSSTMYDYDSQSSQVRIITLVCAVMLVCMLVGAMFLFA